MNYFVKNIVRDLNSGKLTKPEALSLLRTLQENSNHGRQKLHPLVHVNTSDLLEQRFTSTFTGEEFFLRDHLVNGKRVLPEVTYLEMARVAVEKASGGLQEGTSLHLKKVVWGQPTVVDGSIKHVHIGLFPEENGQIQYEVYSEPEHSEEALVHCQGIAEFKTKEQLPPLNIGDIKSQLKQAIVNAEMCYQTFKTMGLDYGSSHQAVDAIHCGESQDLAKLSLPSCIQETQNDYVLHPSLLDSALHSSTNLMMKNDSPSNGGLTSRCAQMSVNSESSLKASFPFTLESLDILGSCTKEMYAWIRNSNGSTPSTGVQKLDIDFCDKEGAICVVMRGLIFQDLKRLQQNQKAIELSQSTMHSDFGSSTSKPQAIELRRLSGVEAIKLEPAVEKLDLAKTTVSKQTLQKQSKTKLAKIHQETISSIPLESIEEQLLSSLAKALCVEETNIDPEKQFIEMGLDSVVGVEWIKEIHQKFKTEFATTKIYDYPTIKELSKYVQKQLKEMAEKNPANTLETKEMSLENPSPPLAKSSETKELPLENPPPPLAKSQENQIYPPSLRRKQKNRFWTIPKRENGNILPSSRNPFSIQPENLGNPLFQERYRCKWSYFSGSMYKKIASEELVIRMSKAKLLSFFGSAGLFPGELKASIQRIQSQLDPNEPYGMCLISNIHNTAYEMQQVELFIRYQIPVIEVAAFATISPPLAYCRVKGLSQAQGKIIIPRRLIGKCSRLEVARMFLSPPPLSLIQQLLESKLISAQEAELSQKIPMMDDLAVEADSGGHTDQGTAFSLIPAITSLRNQMMQKYQYKESILVGCGGGIGTPQAIIAAFQLGAEFIFTGSINQCTVESGAHPVVKDLLSTVSIHDVTTAPAGDMFEIGAKVQVVKKNTQFPERANKLYQLFMQYGCLEAIPVSIKKELEKHYFKRTIEEVWKEVCDYKQKRNPQQLQEAQENDRLHLRLIFQWYFAHSNAVTFAGNIEEKDNFQIHCGPALGSFNQWVQGTLYQDWKSRHVVEITELLFTQACSLLQKQPPVEQEETVANSKLDTANQIHPTISFSPKNSRRHTDHNAIAIIGKSGQFPQAKNLEEFWINIAQGKDCITEIPEDRWSIEKYYDKEGREGKTNSKWMGALENADKFDPLFFNISPVQAEWMDPQQRIFLESAWSCIENAGINPETLSSSRCGVFVGCATGDYGQSLQGHALDSKHLMGVSCSILSARISYLLNLKGPCLSIDTACSSSLVAIIEACSSLVNETSDLALAGGVCVLPGPTMHIMTSQSGMLSKDGRCFTFDARANGFVPGEGVGVLLLKRLKDALQNQDPICAVIRGWGINQDGKTNGITAPSTNSQIMLEKEVYERFRIDPETISMVEAHGTGTNLGDPIEVEALIESFRSQTDKIQFCALGSIKSNIGHLLTAAGVAGVIKVLLSLEHRKLVPCANFQTLNPHISLENSPFYVNTELQDWKSPPSGPRRACVSSFGFSGTNAHLVVEEAPTPYLSSGLMPSSVSKNPILVPISAKNKEQLRVYVEQLCLFLRKAAQEQEKTLRIEDIAYTLQLGRCAMEERIVFMVTDLSGLLEKLQSFLDNQESITDCYQGSIKRKERQLATLLADEDMAQSIALWVEKKKYSKLMKLWVTGLTFDWNQLYEEVKPKRIRLPTYPFVKERYWINGISDFRFQISDLKNRLHPLVHENTSDLSEQCFSSTFIGEEFFLADHRVSGKRVLPGVAYLEMARVAVEKASGGLQEGTSIHLKNVVWAQPTIVDGSIKHVHIGVFAEENGQIQYEMYSESEHNEDTLVHCQGVAEFKVKGQLPPLDIGDIQSQMKQVIVNAETCYQTFKTMGLDYGSSHQAIVAIHCGESQVLAKLSLPSCIQETQNDYILHPSLMDSALQSSIGLIMNNGSLPNSSLISRSPQMTINSESSLKASLPFALESLEILGPCTKDMYAWIRYSDGSVPSDKVQKLDVDLCDSEGNVRVTIRKFSSRNFEGELGTFRQKPKTDTSDEGKWVGLQSLVPVWDPIASEAKDKVTVLPQTKILLIGTNPTPLAWVQESYPNANYLELPLEATIEVINKRLQEVSFDHLLWIACDVSQEINENAMIDAQKQGVLQVFRIVKALLRSGFASKEIKWTLIISNTQLLTKQERIIPTHAGVFGLIGSLAKEYPHWKLRLLDLDSLGSISANECLSLAFSSQGDGFSHRNNEWFEQKVVRMENLSQESVLYRNKGVYIVLGGAGGIGEIWSRFMIQHYKAHIIWIGRREKNESIQEKINSLSLFGKQPLYITADAKKLDSLQRAFSEIKKIYPKIHGVIHSAIVLEDQSLVKMKEATFIASLSVKVDASVNMNLVFGNEDLDFMLFFSSLESFVKAPGQSNYAAGCTFKDSFAHKLNQKHPYPVKIINWGYWGSVGIVKDAFYNKKMEQVGIGSIEPSEAMKALQIFINSKINQIALIKTLKPNVVQNVILEEEMTCYPKSSDLEFCQVQKALPKQDYSKRLSSLDEERLTPEMDLLLTKILAATLTSLGFFTQGISKVKDLSSEKKSAAFYERWLSTSIHYLQKQNFLSGELIFSQKITELSALWEEWKQKKSKWMSNPNQQAQIILLETCLKALPSILTGKQQATDIIFPNSSMKLVERIYKGNVFSDYFNEVLGNILVESIKKAIETDKNRKFRILEIGAGTGGATAKLLPILQEFSQSIIEYCYTDLSKTFLMHAEENYQPGFSVLNTEIFDVSKPLVGQSIARNHFDFVVATNVLHATPSIRETLRNAKATLKNGGILLLNEVSNWSLFSHLTFGLLKGWWLYEDASLRINGSPGLYPIVWKRVLQQEGFESIFFPAEKVHSLGQQIIIASSDGIVRQRIDTQLEKISTKEPVSELEISTPSKVKIAASDLSESLRERSLTYFQRLVAETLKMSPQKLEPHKPLEEYGMDSILVVQLTNGLRKVFPDVTSTLFFEVQSIDGLVDYFLENKKQELITLLQDARDHSGSGSFPSSERTIRKKQKLNRLSKGNHCSPFPQTIKSDSEHTYSIFDVAVIGMSGRYPKSKNLEEFWNNLGNGVNCVSEIPKDRWDWQEYYDSIKGMPGKIYTKWGGFIEDIDKFDPLFFQISPREAERMDPQERLFLETAYHTIEDAAYTPETLEQTRKIGVFVGVMNSRYPLQPAYSSIANRISYLFNFQGPSMAIDTACSSSLTAIHLALESIYNGFSKCAIAGGVNLIIDPMHYFGLVEMGMLSTGNECKSFGHHADGFVDGEGVGALLLKPLNQAIQEGDHIYGVIKGSSINAGGKTNGFTVPNPKAQSLLVSDALQRSKIPAQRLSYIEAHGTGTVLGDPIEIAGLTQAFRKTTDKKQFCAIGSIKSNIGHLESAAGIAGITKVLLQLQHQQLVPSLHASVTNSEIDFTQTPFSVQQKLEEWNHSQQPANKAVQDLPRIAGVSSFGAGGANAHVIVQEYISAPQINSTVDSSSTSPVMIPISARTEKQLQELIEQLIQWTYNCSDKITLQEVAYSLQVGRVAMEERLGLVACSLNELRDKLQQYQRGEQSISDLYLGQVKRDKETFSLITADEDMRETIELWIAKRKYSKLLSLWVKGLSFDWNQLYGATKPKRISLPTYPFAKERYWISDSVGENPNHKSQIINHKSPWIHPLLHENTSDLSRQRFTSTFTGKEFFLNDHQVKGEKVFPGVSYLEMARIAAKRASGELGKETSLELKNIVWNQPLIGVDSNKKVHIELFAEDNVQIQYEVYSTSNNEEQPIVHCQGIVEFKAKKSSTLNIVDIQSSMNQGILSAETCYQAFKRVGLEYGLRFQGIQEIHQGENQVLAKLSLHSSLQNTQNEYVLHPSLMDGAIQSSVGLILNSAISRTDNNALTKLSLPFALESLEILGSCTSEMYAWIRYSRGSRASDKIQKLDLDLCDKQGNICVKMRKFSSRVVDGKIDIFTPQDSIGTLLATPIWKEMAIPSEITGQEYSEHWIVLCEVPNSEPKKLDVLTSKSQCLELKSKQQAFDARYTEYAVRCFEVIKNIIEKKPQGKVLIQLVIPSTGEQSLFVGLSGLLKSATLENPKIIGQIIQIDRDEKTESLVKILQQNKNAPHDSIIKYEKENRWVSTWKELESYQETSVAFKDGGVYLITGGLGSLGILFGKEIFKQTKEAKLILTGRSQLSAQKQSILKELQTQGLAEYHIIDMANLEQVTSLIKSIQNHHNKLDGIIHTAGVISDNFILKKTVDEFRHVLPVKVTGTVNLDVTTKDLQLDFFVLFSSIAGAMGNLGQADYATANAFMDQFAAYRNDLVSANKRKGRTLSISWPLWKEGGMGVDSVSEGMIKQSTGMIAMQSETGIQAFYQSLHTHHSQTLVMEGALAQIRATIYEAKKLQDQPIKTDLTTSTVDPQTLQEKAQQFLKKQFSSIIKLPARKIDAEASFEKYGMDSIVALALTNQLENTFGPLPKTLFFEYHTIAELAGYLVQSYEAKFVSLFAQNSTLPTETKLLDLSSTSTAKQKSKRRFLSRQPTIFETVGYGSLDIAIIGLSGRYPQSIDIQKYWENLRNGKDCIIEVPKQRWDWQDYFSEDRNKTGFHFSKWGGFIEGVDKFDPLFFNISPREAMIMDPQERLFLEHVWMAIEDAGYTRQQLQALQNKDLPGQVGVYAGVMYGEYQLLGAEESIKGNRMGFAGSLATIANRVSYILNLHGPSMIVDSMCSSSLTSIHLACQDLKHGKTDLAIAGGVNITIHPNKYLALSAGQFISTKGHCKSFGEGGDGYIPGEGVGVVLLKRLQDAIEDEDHIYGVILASALNHGGKTNGYTVPNPKAQRSAIETALAESKIDPRWLSYIEAHGTGTQLGDPIEITALTQAFAKYTKEKEFCRIGSAKSNIGHLEGAAAIAGLTKVLLQMKYQQIVPSLHSSTLNPNIDFKSTPFVVNQELMDWDRLGLEGQEVPRTAGISSFGAGGSNAHIIVQEYTNKGSELRVKGSELTNKDPYLIVLSAKNETRLKEVAKNLHSSLTVNREQATVNLHDVAYTLQVGREAMDQRLAFIVTSIQALEKKLDQFLAGNQDIEECYQGQVKRNKETLAVFTADEELQEAIEKWIARKKFSKLLDLWVKGLVFDWNKLYGEMKPKRISLPTYPFAKERFWISRTPSNAVAAKSESGVSVIHPLLHENSSDLSEQRFTSRFTGKEFFFADHQIKGEKVLPAVAYLEMARVAMERASGQLEEETLIRLKNVIWTQPIVMDGSVKEVHIGIFADNDGKIQFEIYSQSGDDEEKIVHSEGIAESKPKEEVSALDVDEIQSQMKNGSLNAEICYQTFKSTGIDYGSGHQGIQEIYQGERQVLAKLSLPSSIDDTQNEYVLHPSLMDSAIQSSIGLMLKNDTLPDHSLISRSAQMTQNSETSLKVSLPFALESLEILGSYTKNMYSWVRYSNGRAPSDKVQKLDIDLCDQQGNVCVKMRGFSSRIFEGEIGACNAKDTLQTIIATKIWKETDIPSNIAPQQYLQHWIFLCEMLGCTAKELADLFQGSQCLQLESKQQMIELRFSEYAAECFEVIQGILQEKPPGKVIIQIVLGKAREQSLFTGLSGLLKTATLENSRVVGQIIQVDSGENTESLAKKLLDNKDLFYDSIIKYEGEKRFVSTWQEFKQCKEEAKIVFKDQGVYLITGGLGGLGILFAKEILQQTKQAKLILTGRSELSTEKQSILQELQTNEAIVEYQRVDVCDLREVTSLLESIKESHGGLNGIIHSAGIISDNFIVKKTVEEFREVLFPKVTGTMNLDTATKDIEMDFFVLFSSVAGAMGNVGQADYSTANAFIDAYAQYRNALVVSGKQQPQTLSLNWPLWQIGGMNVDPQTEKMMKTMGIVPLEATQGIQAFYRCYACGKDQMMVIRGNRRQIAKKMFSTTFPVKSQQIPIKENDLLFEKIQTALMQAMSKLLKVTVEDIDGDAEFGEYGFDSVTFTEFANKFNDRYKLELTPTVFFEHSTIESLTKYLTEEHHMTLAQQFSLETRAVEIKEPKEERIAYKKRMRFRKPVVPTSKPETEAIAVIGISGTFPKAKDINEFWKNLVQGKDCISEIPQDRWDWREYYGDPTQEKNKTNIKWGGFIDGVAEFDPFFFGISPREAELMDPQQRLLMVYVWKVIEDAGYSAQSLSGTKTGVFVGTATSGYDALINQANIAIEGYSSTGIAPSVGPNRMSYFLNIHGPSEPIETACSSSLVAIHRAVIAMKTGGCDQAIAGGVNTIITPDAHISFSKAGMLSGDGRCKTFSNQANGYVRGEGVGMLLLKKLSAAVQAGDHIYGLIRGSAENHGGRANSLTAPNPKAQADLLKDAYTQAGIDATSIGYIEAHGTGTELGDPVEINGLKTAFHDLHAVPADFQVPSPRCGIGSVKANIGHLELAAGVAGVIKVFLQLKYKTLVKSLHCDETNPYINLKESPFYIVNETQEWRTMRDAQGNELPRRAGVSSFGFGGANAHVVIEEYMEPQTAGNRSSNSCETYPIVLSAKNEDILKEIAKNLLTFLTGNRQPATLNLHEVAYTLQVGREAMEERLAINVRSLKELESKLKDYVSGKDDIENLYRGQVKRNKGALAVLGADEDMAKTIDAWITKRKYAKLLDLWVKGLSFDWNKLYREPKPRRMSLPTYPFSQKRYWISSNTNAHSNKPDRFLAPEQEIQDAHDGKYYQPVWYLSPIQVPSRRPHNDFAPMLLFDSSDQLWNQLRLKINKQMKKENSKNIPLILIKPGKCFRKLDAQTFSLNPDVHADYHRLAETLREEKQLPRSVVYLGPWQKRMERGTISNPTEGPTIYPIFFLLQSLMKQQDDRTMKFLYGYTHGEDERYPYNAAVNGLLKTIEVEDGRFKCKSIEWDSDWSGDGGMASPAEQILTELHDECTESTEVCYRGEERWVKRIEAVDLEKELSRIPPAERLRRIRKQGVYLITGGLGGLGLLFAHRLAKEYQAKLVLCGRTAVTPESEQQVAKLRESGTDAIYIQTDVSRREEVKRLMKEVNDRFGGLNGILHSAGLLHDGWLRDKKQKDIETVLAPKVDGTVLLDQATAKSHLDFFVLFSSISAIRGNIGQSDYACANSFLDHFAWWREKQRSAGKRRGQTISINWPPWKEGGMELEAERGEWSMKQTGLIPLKTETGWQAFLQGLSAAKTQFIVLEKGANLSKPCGKHPKQKRLAVKDPENVDATLEEIVSEVTGIHGNKPDRDARWEELGMDSILSMKLLQTIEELLGLRLYPNELVEKDTLGKLTEYVKQEIGRGGGIETSKGKKSQISKRRPLIYLLSTPRAGSTLLRVMLMGHSEVFAPPELHLLPFENLQERAELLAKRNQSYLREGLIETIKEMEGISAADANQRMKAFEKQKLSVHAVYQRLQELAGGRYVVDKSPAYGTDLKTLQRAEKISPGAFYIFLIRHPLSMIESFGRNRFDKLLGIKEDPWKYAEDLWIRVNRNIQQFLTIVPSARYLQIRYEDLVQNPREKVEVLCSRLGIEFQESMICPYKEGLMQNGLYKATSLSIGDPNFMKHKKIEPQLADAWKCQLNKVDQLSAETQALAREYGYSFSVAKSYALAPAQKAFMNRFGADPVWHIVQHFTLRMDLGLNRNRLEKCLQKVVDKHSVLRHRFVKSNGSWQQEESAIAEVKIWHKSLVGLEKKENASQRKEQEQQLHQQLDIEQGRLLACAVMEKGEGDYHIILVLHHLVADGISAGRIFQDLMEYYHASEEKAVKEDQGYRNYVESIEALEQGPELEANRSFWEEQLKKGSLKCPQDYPTGANTIESEKEYRIRYKFGDLGLASLQMKGHFFDCLAVGLYAYLSEWIGHQAPIISHRLHRRELGLNGRYHDTVGWFAGDIPLRFSLHKTGPLSSDVKAFRQKFQQIPMGGVSYEMLVNQNKLPGVYKVCPIRLNYQRLDFSSKSINTDTYPFESPAHDRGYLLDLIVRLKQKDVEILVRYSKNRHKLSTVKKLVFEWMKKTKAFVEATLGIGQPG